MKLFLIGFLLMTLSCSTHPVATEETTVSDAMKSITYLQFRFRDASVPPEYHRSYELYFDSSHVKIVVDSYGTILTDTSLSMPLGTLEKINDLLIQFEIKNTKKSSDSEGCTGGTAVNLTFGDESVEFCSGTAYFCGGEITGDVKGDFQQFKTELLKLIPNFKELLKE